MQKQGHELDYMLARSYSSSLGRFMAVDPASGSARPTNPQSWNRYSYAGNNPVRYVDPNGEDLKLKFPRP
jgi:RHS repeat-associated protein